LLCKGKGNLRLVTYHCSHRFGAWLLLYLHFTSALDGGGWLTPCPGCFTHGKYPVPIEKKAEGAPGLVWRSVEKRKSLHPPAFESRTFQVVVSRHTDYANPATSVVL